MLSEKQLDEIREWLHRSQNPLFFFDNDVDGLASFLLLRRYINTGKGIVIKSYPELNAAYVRRLHELKPDVVFILDKPLVEPGFFEACRELGMPVVWIDHHPVQETGENVYYYNPLLGKESSNEPVSYLCYKVTKKDDWVAMLGCIGDWFLPDFASEFSKKYPDIFPFDSDASKILFGTEFGKLIKILSFAMKDKTTAVINMLKVLWNAKDPYELLHEEKKFGKIHERYNQVKKKYDALLEKAIKNAERQKKNKKLFYFQYRSDTSLSADLANELFYMLKDRDIVVVAKFDDSKVNLSIRGREKQDMREFIAEALKGTEGTGGGHKFAVGARIRVDELPKFKKNIAKLLK